VRLVGLGKLKSGMTSTGMEPPTSSFVEECPNPIALSRTPISQISEPFNVECGRVYKLPVWLKGLICCSLPQVERANLLLPPTG
jgi:hypothetical protein